MIVTLAELESLAKRALAGSGAPSGIDEDAAAATAWLEARDLPALDALVAELDRGVIDLPAPAVEGRQVDAGGRSALLLCGTLIDQAVLLADQGPLTVEQLAQPIFLLPLADRRRRAGWSFRITWGSGSGALVDVEQGLALLGGLDGLLPKAPVTVSIASVRGPLDRFEGDSGLEARLGQTLANGRAVDDGLWQRLTRHGARALVPASEESRARGAGSTASDND